MNTAILSEGLSVEEALRAAAVNSSHRTSRALTKWLNRKVRLYADGFERVPLEKISTIAGAADDAVVAVHMLLQGEVQGDVLLVLPEAVAFQFTDILLGNAPGTTVSIGEFEKSCIQETGNIVATSFANSLAEWLELRLIPGAPIVVHDLSCAVIEPLLFEQAMHSDAAWVGKTEFELDGQRLDWSLLLILNSTSLDFLSQGCRNNTARQSGLHGVVVNAAFACSRSMSKWLGRSVRLTADTFERTPLANISALMPTTDRALFLCMELTGQLHGHLLIVMSMRSAKELCNRLMPGNSSESEDLTEMDRSCLEETANILGTSFANSAAKWLEITTAPASPVLCIDMPEAAIQSLIGSQAQRNDDILVSRSAFHIDHSWVECELFVLPSLSSYRLIESFCK